MSKVKKKPPTLTAELRAEYQRLFDTAVVNQANVAEISRLVTKITTNRQRYEQVAGPLGTMPWWFVPLIHAMESGLNFAKHLHNGDPLTARTTHVPAGRPAAGNPPFTWEASAEDALRMKSLHTWTDWTVPGVLFKLEGYNGWGVRMYHSDTLTAYLWSYTNHYTKGKYASDGKWDANLVSKQPGAAALLKTLVNNGTVAI
jgi:lysozyme family protein